MLYNKKITVPTFLEKEHECSDMGDSHCNLTLKSKNLIATHVVVV